jgi:hypothetical protein
MKLNEISLELPIEFDIIRQALQDGKIVTFQSWMSNREGRARNKIEGRVIALQSSQRPNEVTLSYYEWSTLDKTWSDSIDKTAVTIDELENSTFQTEADGSLHVIIPNHDNRQ